MSLKTAIVATLNPVFDGRFFLSVAPANTIEPYATYQIVTQAPENTIDGAKPNLIFVRLSVYVFGRDALTVEELAEEAKDAMLESTLFKSISANDMDMFEDPSLLYTQLLDFSLGYYAS